MMFWRIIALAHGKRHNQLRHRAKDRLGVARRGGEHSIRSTRAQGSRKTHGVLAYLIGPAPEAYKSAVQSAARLREKLRAERTNLVPKIIETWDEVPLVLQLMVGFDALYGYVGMDDYTLYPFVRPGAFVRIDSRQKKIPSVGWHGDYDRPIFFVELREHYVCTWCEMLDGRLILVPSQQSKRRTQHVRYPAEATIVGRVTGITQDIVEPSAHEVRA